MPDWLSDASANRHIKTYVKDFLDVSGNFTVRNNADYAWNSYGQVISGPYESDNDVQFGVDVGMDVSGLTIIVGAYQQDGANTASTNDGVVTVYRYDTTAEIWYQLGNTITGETTNGDFGFNVDINDAGTRIMATDPDANFVNVYDYNSSTNTWDKQVSITTSDGIEGVDRYGGKISGDGNTIIFGAYTYYANSGKQYVYRNTSGTTWTKIGEFTGTHTYAYIGINVQITYDGNRITGTEKDYNYDADGNYSENNGRVSIHDYSGSGTTWNQVGDWIYGATSDKFGATLDFSKDGSIFAAGTDDGDYVKVFQYDATVDGSWNQLGTTVRGPTGNRYGTNLRLSDDGTVLLVNEHRNDTLGTDNGALYIYKYTNGDWVQQGSTLYSQYTGAYLGHVYGGGMSISGDGSKIVAGGFAADVNGTDSGYVRAWQWSQKTYTNPILDVSGGVLTISAGEEHNPRGYFVSQLGSDIAEETGSERSNTLIFSSDGTTLYIGHQLGYNEHGERTGTFRVMKYRNDGWYRIGSIIAPRESEIGVFQGTLGNTMFSGGGLSSDGTRAMGNWYNQDTDSSTARKGLIRVYDLSGGDWVQVGNDIEGDSAGDLIASGTMSGDGNTVAYRDAGLTYAKIRTYNSSTNTWDLQTTISTNNVIIYRFSYDGTIRVDRNTTTSGDYKVTTHKYANGSWSQIGQDIKSYGVDNNEVYAPAMSKYGDYLIVSEQSSFSSTGVAVVYKYSSEGDIWMQLGGNIQNPFSTEAYFVSTRNISADGKTIIVTDYLNAGIENTGNSGGVAVYKYLDGNWTQIYLYYHGETYNDQLGSGSAMCDNGELFAVSAGGSYFVRTHQITNPPAIKIDKDGVSLDNLFTGDNVTLQCPTLKGVSGATANYESLWGRNPGMGDWRSSFGNQNAGYLYIDNAYNAYHSNFDLLLTGMYTGGGGIYRRGHDLASRYGGGLNFQIRITQGTANDDYSLGIGTTAYYYRLNVAGAVYSNGGYYSSDDRIKHNETPLTNALETIRKLQPRHYIKTIKMYEADHQLELDASGNPLDASGNPIPVSEYVREDGFIAQEVNEIPELKYTFKESLAEDVPHGLDYTSIFTTAVKALQELDALDGERQTKLSSLQARIEALENK